MVRTYFHSSIAHLELVHAHFHSSIAQLENHGTTYTSVTNDILHRWSEFSAQEIRTTLK